MVDSQEPAKNLTRNQRKYVDWLATPKYDRIPATQKALAAELGVHETTLPRWRKRIAQSIVNSVARAKLAEHVPAVFGSIIHEASTGSYQHAKLFLEMVGELSDTERHELLVRYVNDWRNTKD